MEKSAIELCPRLEANRNLPLGCTLISAVSLLPEKFLGRVETVASFSSAPWLESYANVVMVDCNSFTTYANLLFGSKAR